MATYVQPKHLAVFFVSMTKVVYRLLSYFSILYIRTFEHNWDVRSKNYSLPHSQAPATCPCPEPVVMVAAWHPPADHMSSRSRDVNKHCGGVNDFPQQINVQII